MSDDLSTAVAFPSFRTPHSQISSLQSATDVIGAVEDVLIEFLAAPPGEFDLLDPELNVLVATARDAVLAGGKRIRPRFAYWGWRGALPTTAFEQVLPAFAALELLHAFALVHDDIMDRSETRRGRPTAHRALADAVPVGKDNRFGESAAILVGDLCLIWADLLAARSTVPHSVLINARANYERMRLEAIAGQYLDLLGEFTQSWTLERAMLTTRLKTAGYTVMLPLRYGAALSGRPLTSAHLDALTQTYTTYGIAVGEAFQLRDDLLGMFGESTCTGKPIGDDIGKSTALILVARELASAQQLRRLEYFLDRKRREDAGELAELLCDIGALARVQTMIDDRLNTAMQAIDDGDLESEVAAALIGLAQAVVRRTS